MRIHLLIGLAVVFLMASGPALSTSQFVKYKKYLIPVSNTCEKTKVIISTDIRPTGTGEDDDIQSMVHYLASSYRFDTVGLISTPGGDGGNTGIIHWVVDNYAKDRASLIGTTGREYPTAQSLKNVVVQGNRGKKLEVYDSTKANHRGAKLIRDEVGKIINGSGCGPIYVLTWGGVDEVAIALNGNDATESLSNADVAQHLRVYSIGSSNTKYDSVFWPWLRDTILSQDGLWFIHSNITFRGIYQNVSANDRRAIKSQLNRFGCLGDVLSKTSTGSNGSIPIKMGDTPSVLYLMNGDPDRPTEPSWGGQYKLVGNNHTQYWTDGDAGRGSVTPHGTISSSGIPRPSNTIYGAWYEDMRRADGRNCIAEP